MFKSVVVSEVGRVGRVFPTFVTSSPCQNIELVDEHEHVSSKVLGIVVCQNLFVGILCGNILGLGISCVRNILW